MSESEEYVWRSRQGKYHRDKNCIALTTKNIEPKRMRLSIAEAWDIEPCTNCCTNDREYVGHSKWSDFVNDIRGKNVSSDN
jgi:hypothetical protein